MCPFDFSNDTLIYKMRRFVYPCVTSYCRWWARATTLLSDQNCNMAVRDREGVFRGSCINHPTHRFGACQKFILMEGTSKCRSCGCVARSHVSITVTFIFASGVLDAWLAYSHGHLSFNSEASYIFCSLINFSEKN